MPIVVVPDKHPEQEAVRPVTRRQLADRVNRLNFIEEVVVVQLLHPKYGHRVTVTADPLPCDGKLLDIRWRNGIPDNISQYTITGIVLPGTPNAFSFSVENPTLFTAGLSCQLPRQGTPLPERKATRMRALDGVKATLAQHSIRFEGVLTDFSAHSLCVKLRIDKPNSRYWITPERSVHLTLETSHGVIFGGDMKVMRNDSDLDNHLFVLAPAEMNTPRFPNKKYRAKRMCLFPEPSLAFQHPLTGRHIEMNVVDLSGLGVCVDESSEQAMLLPGMILPKMRIKLGTGFAIPCRGQVVYRKNTADSEGERCGVALLDIDIQDHLRLLSLMQRAHNRNAHLNTEVDIETLWEFFFETGFIYPSKYLQLARRKEGFLETFRKTYLEQTSIARHFTFQADGQIQAHLSAVRLYEQTWFQQHHAARRTGKRAIGFEVIQQLAEYFYHAFSLSNDKIGFVAGFYRPENRFPAKYFRAIVKQLKNQKAASLDLFAYFSKIPEFDDQGIWEDLPSTWKIEQTTKGDLVELNGFYEQISGGCMMEALDLRPEMLGRTVIEEEYHKLGMIRRRHLFSVKRDQELMAVVELHEADTELSLSRMDRVITCYVLDEKLPSSLLRVIVRSLSAKLNLDNPPMMIYPQNYASHHELEADKRYEMMILNVLHAEEYMYFLDNFMVSHGIAREDREKR